MLLFKEPMPREPVSAGSIPEKPSASGALGAPATAFLYDWNMLPIGQQLWLKELESYQTYPPLAPFQSLESVAMFPVAIGHSIHAALAAAAPRMGCQQLAGGRREAATPGHETHTRSHPGRVPAWFTFWNASPS